MNRSEMYKQHTIKDLDEWAQQNGLSYTQDDELNLRRVSLLANSLSPGVSQEKRYSCNSCGNTFKQKSHLLRHIRTVHGSVTTYNCLHCSNTFNRKCNLERHMKMHKENIPSTSEQRGRKRKSDDDDHDEVDIEPKQLKTNNGKDGVCNWCLKRKELLPGKKFCAKCGDQGRECRWCHRPLPERFFGKRTDVCERCLTRRENWINRQQQGGGNNALNGTAQTTPLQASAANTWDVLQFFKDNETLITDILEQRMRNVKGMKWFLTLFVKFVKYDQENEAIYAEPVFRSLTVTCTNLVQIEDQLAEIFRNLHNSFQNFERDGSGWSIDKIIKIEVNTVEYSPLEGKSYLPLPPKIQKKKAVLNIKNDDDKCFGWCVIAALHPVTYSDHADRIYHYKQYENELNLDDIEFPMALSQVSKFEVQNKISINVFGLEKDEVYPLHVTNQRNMSHHVNLLLFAKGDKRHYCLIRNLSRLLGDRTAHNGQTHYCNYCLHGFSSDSLLKEHTPYCSPHGPQKLSFPKSEDKQWMKFDHIYKQMKVPFVIYADMESYVQPISTCAPDSSKSSTTRYQKHEPSGFSYMVKCTADELSKTAVVYRGPKVVDTFFEWLLKEEENINQILSQVKPMNLTEEQEKSFKEAKTCHICETDLGADRVRDHDHLNGSYRGAAHNNCNFQFQLKQAKRSHESKFFIPIVFHNLRGYDMHLLMESAGKFKSKHLTCIPNNMEKYLSFSLGNLRFIDSLQFLNESLDTLVTNLNKEDDVSKFHNLTRHYPDKQKCQLLLRKGVFPYDHLTSPAVFEEKSLPPQTSFYNKLNDSDLSETDYAHAQKVWETFQMTTFAQYFDLYLKCDVILLADVFENFRHTCLEYYKLDPAHYYSAPGFSWDAMLKMTGVELQLLNDIDMYLMVESGIRGGIAMISKKFAQANNPKAPGFDSDKPKTWLAYLDCNNLYGVSMSERLPEKDFYWLNEKEIEQLDISNLCDDSDAGYILEVDLEYPAHLHTEHNQYPLAPDSLMVTDEMLSEHSRELKQSLRIKGKSAKKLIPNLLPKKNYVLHYQNLKYYLSKGLTLTTVHRVIGFTQSRWLKPYIEFNTEKRKLAKNAFEKDFFKLMNNSVFGKTMENMRKRVSVELVNTPKRLRKVCAKPNFQSFQIFNEDLVAVNLRKVNIVLNRPIYAGFSILDQSKLVMYRYHFDFMREKYGDRAELLYTDTDSLTYEIQTEDWYKDMMENLDMFDTSNFDKSSPLYNTTNCKVLGKFKDECGGKILEQFVGLRPKMYSMQYGYEEMITDERGDKTVEMRQGAIKRAKGVKGCVVKKQMHHSTYLNCLHNQGALKHQMNMIRSYSHQLYSITINKTSLSPYDDKRYFTGIDSLAYGHCKILN